MTCNKSFYIKKYDNRLFIKKYVYRPKHVNADLVQNNTTQNRILVLSFKLLIQSSGQKPRPGPSIEQTEILVTCGHK